MEDFPYTPRNHYPQLLARALSRTYAQTKSEVGRTLEFTEFCRSIRKMPNYTGVATLDFPRASQKLFGTYGEDIKNIWTSFDSKATSTVKTLFDRKILDPFQKKDGVMIALNYNSPEFYRDTNISISLIDTHTMREIAIVGFFILPARQVEIFQIQGRKKYGVGVDEFGYLLAETKHFLAGLGFKKISIICSDRLFLTRTPTSPPAHIVNHEDLQKWLPHHRKHMKLTYDVNPVRKWGFEKSCSRDYSSYVDL